MCIRDRRPPAEKGDALTADWLDATVEDYNYYVGLRDEYLPGKPIWITETAQAACGGSPWASSFLDTFRYVNQLGLLAQRDVNVVFHNTLAASDYSLIDEETLEPNPNYWAAYLWNRLMGTRVLEAPSSPSEELRLYAHCLKGSNGGVAIAAVNYGTSALNLSQMAGADSWVMTAQPIDSETVWVNGSAPVLNEDGSVSGLVSATATADRTVPARSVAFYAVKAANNPACS